ncbi:MAG TPA: RluA family pseudouridine synthase, partial [Micavibrio sp.]
VVHPGAGNWTGTLVNALLYHCGATLSGIGGVMRPGIVHRLDKETSGLMVVAKSDEAHKGLSAQLEDRSLSRTYTALVWNVTPAKGLIDKPIARSGSNRLKMGIPFQGGREARTRYRQEGVFRNSVSLVECDLETGRTHQIRVHMQSIGHPLLGDPLYGLQPTGAMSLLKKAGYEEDARREILSFPRQALNASRIRFVHPVTDEELGFSIDLPGDMERLISILSQ